MHRPRWMDTYIFIKLPSFDDDANDGRQHFVCVLDANIIVIIIGIYISYTRPTGCYVIIFIIILWSVDASSSETYELGFSALHWNIKSIEHLNIYIYPCGSHHHHHHRAHASICMCVCVWEVHSTPVDEKRLYYTNPNHMNNVRRYIFLYILRPRCWAPLPSSTVPFHRVYTYIRE